MKRVGILLLFTILALMYLWPGAGSMLDGRTDLVMSDGTDPTTLPYQYGAVLDAWKTRPLDLFYGAVPAATMNAPEGFALWVTWSERWAVVLFSPVLPVEQISTLLVVVLLVVDALAMYALGRQLSWSRSLSVAMAIGWAFSAYTRARASVHMAFAGVYHLPLVFLGLVLVGRGKSWKSVVAAAACFLAAMTISQYYIVFLAFLSPFLLAYLLISSSRDQWLRVAVRAAVAALPAVAFLAWCFLKPLPSDFAAPGTIVRPPTGEMKSGELHPFLTQFAARPVDYWTGDIGHGVRDWNPLRGYLTTNVLRNLGDGIPHERANGVRWAVWLLALTALVAAFHPKTKTLWQAQARREFLVLAVFAGFAFWLSLSPNVPFERTGPSFWLHSLVSQIRVPSRAGIHVQFALLLMAGLFFHQVFDAPRPAAPPPAKKKKEPERRWPVPARLRWLAKPAVLPLIMISELPPFVQRMPMAPVLPAYAELQGVECGAGLYFPYVSGSWQLREHYDFQQRMRGSQCQILNAVSSTPRDEWFQQRMPLRPQTLAHLQSPRPALVETVKRLAACVPLTWLVFDAQVPAATRQSMCSSMGWRLSADGVCRAEVLAAPVTTLPERCF